MTQGQSEAAAEGAHPVLCTGGAYTARKRQKLHNKVCDLCVEVSEVLSSKRGWGDLRKLVEQGHATES